MILTNPWVSYLDRSYQQVKVSVLTRLGTSNPEITDYSESNPLIILIDIFSGLIEDINYYIDQMAREAFLETAEEYVSIIRLIKPLDYRVHLSFPAGVNLKFMFVDSGGTPTPTTGPGIIPAGTICKAINNFQFTTIQDTVIPIGATEILIGARQQIYVSAANMGTTNGVANQKIPAGLKMVHGSLSLLINSELWVQQRTFARSGPSSKHFIVDVDVDGLAYIIFGDGVFGKIPTSGFVVYGTFRLTEGAAGNNVVITSINTIVSTLSLPGVTAIKVINDLNPTGGSDYESFELLKTRAPLSVRTLERAVTFTDHEDMAMLHPSVKFAKLDFCCTYSCARLYIAPVSGGIADLSTIQSVQQWMDCGKMIRGKICVRAAGLSYVMLSIKVTARLGQDPANVLALTQAALLDWGSYNNSNINRSIRYSDISVVVDSQLEVDFSNILVLKTKPYARPDNHVTELLWNIDTPDTALGNTWRVDIVLGTSYRIIKDNVYLATLLIGTTYTDYDIVFTMLPGSYSDGMAWDFKTYKTNQDQVISDYSVPILEPGNLAIEVVTQEGLSCKSNCSH